MYLYIVSVSESRSLPVLRKCKLTQLFNQRNKRVEIFLFVYFFNPLNSVLWRAPDRRVTWTFLYAAIRPKKSVLSSIVWRLLSSLWRNVDKHVISVGSTFLFSLFTALFRCVKQVEFRMRIHNGELI